MRTFASYLARVSATLYCVSVFHAVLNTLIGIGYSGLFIDLVHKYLDSEIRVFYVKKITIIKRQITNKSQ